MHLPQLLRSAALAAGLLLTLASVGPLAQPPSAAAQPPLCPLGSFDGPWEDSVGGAQPLVLMGPTGTYDSEGFPGTISGAVESYTADGALELDGNFNDGRSAGIHGVFHFVMAADCNSWTGYWRHTGDTTRHPWTGVRS